MANNTYDQIMTDRGGYARVRIGDKWGAINAQGEEIIPVKYDEMFPICCERANVRIGNYWQKKKLEINILTNLLKTTQRKEVKTL